MESISRNLLILNKNRTKNLDHLRAKKIFIRKAEDVPYLGYSYKSLISDWLKEPEENIVKLQI